MKVFVLPQWLENFLIEQNHPIEKAIDINYLIDTLSIDDVAFYFLAQLPRTINIINVDLMSALEELSSFDVRLIDRCSLISSDALENNPFIQRVFNKMDEISYNNDEVFRFQLLKHSIGATGSEINCRTLSPELHNSDLLILRPEFNTTKQQNSENLYKLLEILCMELKLGAVVKTQLFKSYIREVSS